MKFDGRYGTATVTVPPLAKPEVTDGAWLIGTTVDEVPLQADAMTATPPRRTSAAFFSSTEATGQQ